LKLRFDSRPDMEHPIPRGLFSAKWIAPVRRTTFYQLCAGGFEAALGIVEP